MDAAGSQHGFSTGDQLLIPGINRSVRVASEDDRAAFLSHDPPKDRIRVVPIRSKAQKIELQGDL